jgi:hypothetical protein
MMPQAVVQEVPRTNTVFYMHLVRYIKLKINFFQAVHFTVVALQQVMHTTSMKCFHLCSCGP